MQGCAVIMLVSNDGERGEHYDLSSSSDLLN